MALNGVMIKINDIFDDLRHENNRLFNELLFANNYINALNTFKDHLFAIYCKCDTIVTEEDKQLITALSDQLKTLSDDKQKKASLEEIRKNVIDVTDGQQTSRSNGQKKAIRKTPEEDNEDSDETYVDNKYEKSLKKKTPKTEPTIASMKIKRKANKTKVESKSISKSKKYGKQLAEKATKRLTASGMTSRRTEFECRHTGCGQTYDRVSHLRRHQISHMTDRPFRCEYESCDAVFDYKYLLGQHMAKLHGNPAAEAVRRRRLENQRCFDPTTGVYVCPHTDCAKEYDTYEKFTHHLRVVHPSVRYPCGHQGCHKSFKTRMQLRRHQWTHSDHKPHRCQHPGCAYATSHKDNLRHHSVIHLAERPVYRCEERDCQKSYNTPAGLRQHVNNEHRSTDMARRHRCSHPNCDRSYVTRQRLKSHMASHSAEPTLRCGRCQELFHTEWYLTKHVNTVHLNKPMVQGFKPIYPCEWPGCDYKGTRTALRNHRNLHTGDKPFACDWPECDKRFRLAATLRDHKNIHYNLRPYACHWPGCQYSCSNSGNLAKHVKQSHPK